MFQNDIGAGLARPEAQGRLGIVPHMSVPFAASSHSKHWLHASPEVLTDRRRVARERAIAMLGEAAASSGTEDDLTPLPAEEEALLLAYWEMKMQEVCRSENARDPSRFTDRVLAAAQLYFKRFFLVVSPMEESPLAVMFAALYLAGKVEEERIELDRLVELSKLTPEVLLEQEMRLLEKLRFQLLTRSPFRCLAGLEQDLHAALAGVSDGSAAALAELPELRVATRAALKRALCADTPLLFSPLHMALSALLEANRARSVPIDVAAWMHKQFGDEVGAVAGALEGPGAGSSLVELLQRVESTTASSLSQRVDLSAKQTKPRLKHADTQLKRLRLAVQEAQRQQSKKAKFDKTEQLEGDGAAALVGPLVKTAARRGGRGATGGARSEPRQAGSIGIPIVFIGTSSTP
ncbi:cyclin h [Chrysochromulina tobinii]|uniref:Cyclin h n=1 Tax=Chrysochromulina tobinii TaxID=1460289 RepID=A0A0M0JUL9_9EUKA|nr:cyclin h [Chrysochromulina tobinii]|eukprot:KOO30210.1 cyclin h [Chrysochromulina sp. CCMP291]